MSNDEAVYVKDLEGQQKKELLKKMQEAGLKGALEMYKISSAQEKLKEYESKLEKSAGPEQEKIEVEKTSKKILICHICRGDVIDNVCTQCGFSLQKGV